METASGTLEQPLIAAPCGAAWERMEGYERVLVCSECRENVYHLSAMSRADIEALVFETDGRICVRFHQRRDDSVLTQNSPARVREAKLWLGVQLAGIAATFASLLWVGAASNRESERPPKPKPAIGNPAWNEPVPPGAVLMNGQVTWICGRAPRPSERGPVGEIR